jgi:hypothetical protein
MKCERAGCPRTTSGYELFDYCKTCSKNLCSEHMKKGCCGKVPAESGMGEDDAEDEEGKDGYGT